MTVLKLAEMIALRDFINKTGLVQAEISYLTGETLSKSIAITNNSGITKDYALFLRPVIAPSKISLALRRTKSGFMVRRLGEATAKWVFDKSLSTDLFRFISERSGNRYVMNITEDVYESFLIWADKVAS